MSTLEIPSLCLVVSIDERAAHALALFAPEEVLRLQTFERMLGDGGQDRARELLRSAVEHRLALGHLTAVDAGALGRQERQDWVRLGKSQHVPTVALSTTAARLDKEGFDVRRVSTELSRITRVTPASHRQGEHGPFDIIGDVHGCASELRTLLGELGYRPDDAGVHRHPEGRRALFLGDLVDRGPDAVGALRIAMGMVEAGVALVIEGNHEAKLLRKLRGKNVKLDHGLDRTWAQFEREDDSFHREALAFLEARPHHLVLDGGQLVCAHAGLAEAFHGRESGRVRSFALYGDTTGDSDAYGLPVRRDWAGRYRGAASVIYGHTPVSQALWRNRTLCIDTGCVFGGELTALRWPERELVSVPAEATHYPPPRPLEPPPALPRLEGAIEVVPWEGPKVRVSAEAVAASEARLETAPTGALVYLPADLRPTTPSLLDALTELHAAEVGEVLVHECEPEPNIAAVIVRGDAAPRFDVSIPGIAFDADARALPQLAGALAGLADAAERTGLFDALATDWLLLEGAARGAELWPHLLLASEGRLHVDRDRGQHLVSLAELGPTPEAHRVHLPDRAAWQAAIEWAAGREVVVSPLRWPSRSEAAAPVPSVLRVASESTPHVGGRPGKRHRWHAARRELMGLEALRRFVEGMPPARVRECVVAALATP